MNNSGPTELEDSHVFLRDFFHSLSQNPLIAQPKTIPFQTDLIFFQRFIFISVVHVFYIYLNGSFTFIGARSQSDTHTWDTTLPLLETSCSQNLLQSHFWAKFWETKCSCM